MPLIKSENPISDDFPKEPKAPSFAKALFLASRPKTWSASICPVVIGASFAPSIRYDIFFLTLFFSLLIQIGTNFANDYFDFIKGADTKARNGPKRASEQGWIAPKSMFFLSLATFLSAFLIALPLMLNLGAWSFLLAFFSILSGIFYTAGPKPLGYVGLGEVFVFFFFGPIATAGAFFLQTGFIDGPILIASIASGCFSTALLAVNNLRDEKTDRAAKKNTLIVRFGALFGKLECSALLISAGIIPFILVGFFSFPPSYLLPLLSLPLFFLPLRKIWSFQDPLELIAALPMISFLFCLYTILFVFAR